jgi:hypothetical protein
VMGPVKGEGRGGKLGRAKGTMVIEVPVVVHGQETRLGARDKQTRRVTQKSHQDHIKVTSITPSRLKVMCFSGNLKAAANTL